MAPGATRAARRVPGLLVAIALLFCRPLAGVAQELVFPGGVIWQITLDPPPALLPAFDDHSAYLVLRDGNVRAINHATGATRWTSPASSTVTPASSGRHLAGADGSTAWALDAASGRAAWHVDLGTKAAASPVITQAGAVFVTENGDLVLLAWADGREAWRVHLPARVSAPVAAGIDRVWAGLEDGRVVAFGLADGATALDQAARRAHPRHDAIDDRLFTGAADNFLYALRTKNGDAAWRWRTGGDVVGHAVADDRRVYFTSLDAMLRAVNRRHGDLRWQRPLTSRAVGGPVLAAHRSSWRGCRPKCEPFGRATAAWRRPPRCPRARSTGRSLPRRTPQHRPAWCCSPPADT